MHIHVHCAEGEAKFWMEPEIGLAYNHLIRSSELAAVEKVIREHHDEISRAWHEHFGR